MPSVDRPRPIRLAPLGLSLLGLAFGGGLARADAPPAFALPIACVLGKTCFIQQYADDDPGPGEHDYACGSRTYDKHTGVDIRVPTTAARKAGVEVRAAAPGIVEAVRDGVDDAVPLPIPPGQDCGNTALISHGDGWETIYCHMQKGSVVVKTGQYVKTGDKLGLVGQSGDAAFPHLHFEVRKSGHWVDPFAYGAKPGQCRGGANLFDPAAAKALAYTGPDLLNAGFAATPPTANGVEAGLPVLPSLPRDAPAIVFYVRLIGLDTGDAPRLVLKGPDGAVLADDRLDPMTAPRAQQFAFVGKKHTADWPAGVYTGTVTVIRAGRTVLESENRLTVK